jgi:hypothetical protein
MSNHLGLYSADQVFIVWGPLKLEGRGPETFCKVARNKKAFSLKVGADGEGARSRILDHSGKVTVTLQQPAQVNALLAAAELADEKTANGLSIFPLMVKDCSGNRLWVAEKAWLTGPADGEMAAEAGTTEWEFETDDLETGVPAHA